MAVFLDEKKAHEALPAYTEYDEDGEPYDWGNPSIVTIPLEPEFPVCPEGHKAYMVRFSENGMAHTEEHDCLGEYNCPEGRIDAWFDYKNVYRRVFWVDVIARDRDHAVKVASEKWTAFKAKEAGITQQNP